MIASYVAEFLKQSVVAWETSLTTCKQMLCTVKYEQIFQGTGLSTLMYDLCIISLMLLLTRVKFDYNWGRGDNQSLIKYDLKLFGKTYEQNESLVRTVHTFGKDKGMEFVIKKCGVKTSKK